MEEQWIIDRTRLRQLMRDHPEWSTAQCMQAVGRSRKWVQKWRRRLRAADPDDDQVLHSQSRARKTHPDPYAPDVIAHILDLRDHPPATVPRVLGAPAIPYYLHQNASFREQSVRLPSSTSTLWKILHDHQRLGQPPRVEHQPFVRPAPMDTWEIDFTDVSTAAAPHADKQQHQVEAFAVVDRGTSILVDLQTGDDYQAQNVLLAMAGTLIQQGIPRGIVFDRDPRFVGSWSMDRFPSAFMRFLLTLGIAVEVCPARRPDLKPFVERYFRTLQAECIRIQRPETVAQTQEVFEAHRYVYNHERPNQANVCGNRPPYVAFPVLPRLPHLPMTVDPDHWLLSYHQHVFKRRITSAGTVQVDKHRYYLGRDLAGRYVVLKLDADRRVFEAMLNNRVIKTLPIKGLYLDLMVQEAEAEWRRLQREQRRLRQAA